MNGRCMVFDLAAGTKAAAIRARSASPPAEPPRVLVFDSGLGGLTVYPEVTAAVPGGTFMYLADDALFPYGGLSEATLVARVLAVMHVAIADFAPDLVVIACGTASTLVLPPLRARWPTIHFVGTVPAIKPAAATSATKRISVLATPGTVKREYTRDLIETFAADCRVTLVGAQRLAAMAEALMRGEPVSQGAIAAEVAPAFVDIDGARTDTVVLACTHYPLLRAELDGAAPWPVRWIDPAPAIARRVRQILDPVTDLPVDTVPRAAPALFSSNVPPVPALAAFLAARRLKWQSSAALAALPRTVASGS